ncbi:hypothetical protein COCON_G00200920 [Conger conger]|uniref:Uncharacterized protein n=1 Tax=Conger conger TaxID=82655 RepID=A0A9Q1D2V3_CONCO|nr:hypothetical protein COCON_G00200920 [Conger conger]
MDRHGDWYKCCQEGISDHRRTLDDEVKRVNDFLFQNLVTHGRRASTSAPVPSPTSSLCCSQIGLVGRSPPVGLQAARWCRKQGCDHPKGFVCPLRRDL